MSLPKVFCWTRFGTEAGEEIGQIVARKEEERLRNGGVFLWGIGNPIGPSIGQLIRLDDYPEVIFSPICSAPRKKDTSPEQVVAWTVGETLDGKRYKLPAGSLVTSRYDPQAGRKNHYALVCSSPTVLQLNPKAETISFGSLRNLLTNRPVGASQVTAIVRRTNGHSTNCSLLIRRPFELG